MEFTEAEIQVLASIHKVLSTQPAADGPALDQRAESYWIFREDWTEAFPALSEKGLIEETGAGWILTEAGHPIAAACRAERVDMYWYYSKFYVRAHASAAHSELCRRVFGLDLTQEGQTDMASLRIALEALALKPGQHMLDLGCGAGVIAEYISDTTGARVTGLDFAESAISAARSRTEAKGARLDFRTANFNTMAPAPDTYDAVLSMDTLYWATDLQAVLATLAASLKAGGRIAIFMNHHVGPDAEAEALQPEHASLGKAASALGLTTRVIDFSANLGAFWERNYAAALALRDQFETEGNRFIADSLIRESEQDYLPDIREGRVARYLFLIDAPS